MSTAIHKKFAKFTRLANPALFIEQKQPFILNPQEHHRLAELEFDIFADMADVSSEFAGWPV